MRPILAALAALMLAAPAVSLETEHLDVRVSWEPATAPGTTDPSATHDYEVQTLRSGGAWTTVAEVEETQVDLQGEWGETFLVRVRGRTVDGRAGPWSEASEPVTFVQPVPQPGVPMIGCTAGELDPDALADGRLVCR